MMAPPISTPKWSFLAGKPMVGYHHLGNPYIWSPTGSEDTQAQLQAQSSLGEACPSAGDHNPTSLISIQMYHAKQAVFFWNNMAKVGAEFCASIILLEWKRWPFIFDLKCLKRRIVYHCALKNRVFRCPKIRMQGFHRFPHPVNSRRFESHRELRVITIKLSSCKIFKNQENHFCWKWDFQSTSASVWVSPYPQWPQVLQTWGVLLGLQSRRHMMMRPLEFIGCRVVMLNVRKRYDGPWWKKVSCENRLLGMDLGWFIQMLVPRHQFLKG